MEPFLIRIVAVRLVGSTWWRYTEYTTYYIQEQEAKGNPYAYITNSHKRCQPAHSNEKQLVAATMTVTAPKSFRSIFGMKTIFGGKFSANTFHEFTQSFIIEVDCLISVGDILQSIYQS